MGGRVERTNALCYELGAAHLQTAKQSNFIPIGELEQGSFQHRALLYKVSMMLYDIGCGHPVIALL